MGYSRFSQSEVRVPVASPSPGRLWRWWFSHCHVRLLQSQRLQPARLLCPWDSPGKNTGVSCHSLLQGIFLNQGSNPCFLQYRQIFYSLSHQGGPQLASGSSAPVRIEHGGDMAAWIVGTLVASSAQGHQLPQLQELQSY